MLKMLRKSCFGGLRKPCENRSIWVSHRSKSKHIKISQNGHVFDIKGLLASKSLWSVSFVHRKQGRQAVKYQGGHWPDL